MSILTSLVSLWIRDIGQIIPVVVQLLFLISPIMYQKEALRNLQIVTKFNPLFQYLEPLREAFISGNVETWGTIIDLIISITLLIITIQSVVKLKYKIIDLVLE